jgi:hypothetical protein
LPFLPLCPLSYSLSLSSLSTLTLSLHFSKKPLLNFKVGNSVQFKSQNLSGLNELRPWPSSDTVVLFHPCCVLLREALGPVPIL